MVRTILLVSIILFASACPRGSQVDPSVPGPLRGVKIQPWPENEVTDPWRVDGQPAFVIVTLGGSDAAAIVWVTPNGRDLRAVYCVDQARLENMRAQLRRQRDKRFDDFIELTVQADKHTTVCSSTSHAAGTPPAPPPAPPAPPEPTAAAAPLGCPSIQATCNFVMPSPAPKGPAGHPPIFEIVRIFDSVMWQTGVFVIGKIEAGGQF